MRMTIKGYFKFSRVRELKVKTPYEAVAETLLRHSAGYVETLAGKHAALNSIFGKCAEAGWYRGGGWLPHGGGSWRCAEKDKGDVLGVCAFFGPAYRGGTAAWLYCDKEMEEAVAKDFLDPAEYLKNPFLRARVVEMNDVPDQKWLDAFCERTHSPEMFARRRGVSKELAAQVAAKDPDLAGYVKLMWRT